MKIGLFTEFSYAGKSEGQTYAEVLEQIALADELEYDFFSTTESFGKDVVSCSPFSLGLYVAAAQRARRIRFLTGIITVAIHHPVMLASEIAAADLLTGGRIIVGLGRGHPWVLNRIGVDASECQPRYQEGIRMLVEIFSGGYIEKSSGNFWRFSDFQLSPAPIQKPHPPLYVAAATTPDSAVFASETGHGLVQPGYLGINLTSNPLDIVLKSWGTWAQSGHEPNCTDSRTRSPALHGAHEPRAGGRQRDWFSLSPIPLPFGARGAFFRFAVTAAARAAVPNFSRSGTRPPADGALPPPVSARPPASIHRERNSPSFRAR